jgi:hypothetical protein
MKVPFDNLKGRLVYQFVLDEKTGKIEDISDSIDWIKVRHGRWIRDEFGTRCGACGLYAYRDKFDQPWESPYCPNCGAKMDGEQHDHTD